MSGAQQERLWLWLGRWPGDDTPGSLISQLAARWRASRSISRYPYTPDA